MKEAWLNPKHPERVCWGCDLFCPAETLGCANGSIRTPHPKELFGDDWLEWFERDRGARDVTPSRATTHIRTPPCEGDPPA